MWDLEFFKNKSVACVFFKNVIFFQSHDLIGIFDEQKASSQR